MKAKLSLTEFEHLLRVARNTNEVNEVLQRYLNGLGITMFSFTYYFYYTNALNKLKFDFASKQYKAWHEHYLAENYEEIDSTLEKVIFSVLPESWDIHDQLKNAASEKERQMRLDSIAFGVEKGISIPIHGPQGNFANFLVAQMQGEKCLENWQNIQYDLFAASYYYFAYIQKHLLKNQVPDTKHQLNKREMQCLSLVAQQYSVAMIAAKLHLTERTVNYYIQRVNKKLGTKNKHQSAAKAIRLGLINI